MMEGSHHYSCNHAQTEEKEGTLSSLIEETKMPLQNVLTLHHSQDTHSQVAPRWTLAEMLVLVREKWIVENEIPHSSKVQNNGGVSDKWNLVSSHCKASKVERTAEQCRKKWESLSFDYKKIKNWEFQFEAQSYWNTSHNAKKHYKLPSSIERELFDAMDAHLSKMVCRSSQATFDSLDSGANGLFTIENDFRNDMLKMQDPTPSGNIPEPLHVGGQKKRSGSPANEDDIEHVISTAIHENSQNIRALLREATQAHIHSSQLEREMYWRRLEMNRELQLQISELDRELRRKQSEDLIEVLGGLVNAINHLVDAIQNKRSQELNTP